MTRLQLLFAAALCWIHAAIAHPADVDAAASVNVRGFCAAVTPPGFVREAAKLVDSPAAQDVRAGNFRTVTTPIQVKIFMHIVAASKNLSDGYVPKQVVIDQFNVLKTLFAPSNINFILGKIDYRIDASEAIDTPGTELAMKKRLRKGDYKALNFYFMKNLRQNALGYCTFPAAVQKPSDNFYLDGCSVRYDSMPGGTAYGYNLGKTAVHEAGHWFGLLHTFEGASCTGSGDLISDTPAELTPTNGCPTRKDTCPNQAGLDPVHNYMDYSTDECYNQFTPLQGVRMLDMFNQYRLAG